MKTLLLSFTLSCLLSLPAFAQGGISVNTTGTNPDNSAMLDVQSTTKGILIPRMTEAQRTAIASPATGLMVYQTDNTAGFYYYNGSAWASIGTGSFTETDPKVATTTTGRLARWNGTSLVDGLAYDNSTTIGIGTTTMGSESRLALGAFTALEGGQLQLNSGTSGSVGYHIDNYNDNFRILSGTNTITGSERFIINNAGRVGIGTSTISTESKLAIGAVSVAEGGHLQLNSGTGGTVGYHLDNFSDKFRILSGTNTATVSERLVIDNTGNIGIGIITPTEKLDVSGKTRTTTFQMTASPTNGHVLQSDASGNGTWVNPATLSITESDPKVGTLTTNYHPKWNGTTLANGLLYDNGTNVGLGTTSPSDKLHVVGNARIDAGRLDFRNTGNSIFIGEQAGLNDDLTTKYNTFVGFYAGKANTSGLDNTALGAGALENITTGSFNVGVGRLAGIGNTTGSYNTYLGSSAGYNSAGSNNVFLGNQAGNGQNVSNRLFIDNSSTTSPLIYGEFDNDLLRINGTLNVNNAYSLPTTAGTANYILQTNGTGTASWVNPSTLSIAESDPQVASTTSNYVPKWNGTSLIDGLLYDNGTNIGIGTASPTTKWHVVGNTTLDGTLNLSSSWNMQTGSDFLLEKSGTRYLTVYGTGGNVGIGTSTPAEKLDVAGKTRTTTFQMTTAPTNGYVLQSDASGNGTWVNPTSLAITESDPQVASSTSNYVPKWSGTSLIDGLLYDNGTNVGIGTASPTSKFHVVGDATIAGTVNMNNGWNMQTGADFFLEKSGTRYLTAYGLNGYIGIGTNTPTEKLDVVGKTRTTTFQMTTAPTNGYVLQSDASGNGTWVNPTSLAITESDPQVASTTSNYVPKWNGTSLIDGLLYDNGTNVGIGTASPTTKLHVVGNTTLDGTLNLSSNWNMQTGSDFFLEKSGTRYMTVYGTGGNIGIGTSTPNNKLDVQGTTSTTAQVQSSGSGAFLSAVAPSGQEASNNFKTYSSGSAINRWTVGKSNATESGSNAGSDLFINRHNDAGTYSGQPLSVSRANGTVTIGNDSPSTTANTLKVNGSVAYAVMTINTSSNSTTLNGDDYLVVYSGTTSGNTLTLPAASSCVGRVYVVINHSTSSVTSTSYLVADGTSTPVITAGSKVHFVSDGTNWHKLN